MSLLLPEFNLTDVQTTNSSPPDSQPANECPSADEQPCCSKDLKDGRREGTIQEKEESKEEKTGREEETKGKEEKKRCEDEDRRDGNEQEEKKGTEGEDEGEEEESSEEDVDEDAFIRTSGLLSHAYSLDLNLHPGGYMLINNTTTKSSTIKALIVFS